MLPFRSQGDTMKIPCNIFGRTGINITKLLARIKAVAGKCWSTPAVSNCCIFVRSTEECACLEARQSWDNRQ